MSKPLIWTSIAAVLVSSFSLAASGWVIANERSERAHAPQSPVAAVSTTGKTVDDDAHAGDDKVALPVVENKSVDEAPAPKPAPAPVLEAADLTVRRLVVASGVKDREPVGASGSFAAGDDRVYAFVEMANRSSHDGGIVIVFEHGSTRAGMVELEIPAQADRWRTWGFSRALRQAGTWDVVVREQTSGKELARTSIEVTAAKESPDKAGEAPAANPEAPAPASVAATVVEKPVNDGLI